jgi:hypothetical protein
MMGRSGGMAEGGNLEDKQGSRKHNINGTGRLYKVLLPHVALVLHFSPHARHSICTTEFNYSLITIIWQIKRMQIYLQSSPPHVSSSPT